MTLQSSVGLLEAEMRKDAIIARFARQVSLCGQVAEDAAERLKSLLTETSRKRLLVDFGNVESLTSFMLGQLVMLNRTAVAGGKQLALFNLSPYVRQTIEVARLNLLLSIYDDEAAALSVGTAK